MEVLTRATARRLSQVRFVGDGDSEIIHINDALTRAEESGLDLVLVSTEATPPVVRVQDFKKVAYEKKKARKAQRHQSTLKEIQFKINISDHDFATKVGKIERFLGRGDKVKITVRLKGRERENPQRARSLIERVANSVECRSSFLPGPVSAAILEPPKVVKPAGGKSKAAPAAAAANHDERKSAP